MTSSTYDHPDRPLRLGRPAHGPERRPRRARARDPRPRRRRHRGQGRRRDARRRRRRARRPDRARRPGRPGRAANRASVNYLLGPGVYPVWRGIVTVLLGVLIPILSIWSSSCSAADLTGRVDVGHGASPPAIATAFNAAVQTLFWFTLVFALIERVASAKDAPGARATASAEWAASRVGARLRGETWTVDDLPPAPDAGRMTSATWPAAIVANIVLIVGLLWGQTRRPSSSMASRTRSSTPPCGRSGCPGSSRRGARDRVHGRGLPARPLDVRVRDRQRAPRCGVRDPALYLLANHLLFNPAFVDALGDGAETGSDHHDHHRGRHRRRRRLGRHRRVPQGPPSGPSSRRLSGIGADLADAPSGPGFDPLLQARLHLVDRPRDPEAAVGREDDVGAGVGVRAAETAGRQMLDLGGPTSARRPDS